ncbi:MAG: PEP-CTERM sorting domain-containing protein [Terrimicrobiaceae bacterium]
MNTFVKSKTQPASILAAVLLSVCALLPSAQAVVVTGGDIIGIGSSATYQAAPGVLNADYSYWATQADGAIHLRLDMGSIQNVASLQITNRTDVATALAPLRFTIYVANEAAPGFDFNNLTYFTTVVFANGVATPSSNAASAVQGLNVTDFSKRYVLIDITANGFANPIDNVTPNGNRAQYSDVSYTVVPEPGTVALFGFAAFGMACLRRFRRI